MASVSNRETQEDRDLIYYSKVAKRLSERVITILCQWGKQQDFFSWISMAVGRAATRACTATTRPQRQHPDLATKIEHWPQGK